MMERRVVVEQTGSPDLAFGPGDHVCAFYSGGGTQLDELVADFVSRGLRAGDKCICFIDVPSSVLARIPQELLAREDDLQFFSEEEGYLPTGDFSAEAFIAGLDATARAVLDEGYKRLWLVGDTSVVARKAIDLKQWFATEAQVSEMAQRYPHSIMCLYDLDLYDGETVMYVLKTHTRIYVNGLVIENPYYTPKQQLVAEPS